MGIARPARSLRALHGRGGGVRIRPGRREARRGGPQVVGVGGQAPSTVAESPPLPTSDREVLADMMDLGGTDPRLLDEEDFVELLVRAVQADYRALDRYACAPD